MKPEDIRDIRAPLPISPWWHWPLAIALAAIVAFAVVMLVRAWQKRRSRQLTPLERAREALRVAEDHARAGRSRQWADVVSETLRASLAARLGADVLPQTTTELGRSEWAESTGDAASAESATMTVARVPEGPRLLELLASCDLARFALASFDSDALIASTSLARELVEGLLGPKSETEPTVSRAPELSPS